MATYSLSVSLVKRSEGRSIVAAAAYYARALLHDERKDAWHDYRDRGDLVASEIMLPDEAPDWCRRLDREALWNQVEAVEKRKDAQLGRAVRVMIPRELNDEDRIQLVRDYVRANFTSRGMIADVSFHCPPASTGGDNPHAHILLTLRTLGAWGFGPKQRHEMIPDPEGRTDDKGNVLLVPSNAESWNTVDFLQGLRESWEKMANSALERAGSEQRIDRRTLLERGLARMPEPALRLAFHLKDLRGVMVERWGQFVAARHYKSVETRARAAFYTVDAQPASDGRVDDRPAKPRRTRQDETPAQKAWRFWEWIDRQLDRLAPASGREHGRGSEVGRDPPAQSVDLER